MILGPPFLSVAFVAVCGNEIRRVSLVEWVVLVMCIDVAHVYSTLFKTYLDPKERKEHGRMLVTIPVLGFLFLLLASIQSSLVFWRVLAYIAVFHFVRQQYGFMRLYSRHEEKASWIDTVAIHMAAIFPLVYWHTHDRAFQWFVAGDFLRFDSPGFYYATLAIYVVSMIAYLVKESFQIARSGIVNIPKQAILIGTAVSWYFGIVYYDGDLAFTITNVVSHGIPYIALVWLYGRKNAERSTEDGWLKRAFTIRWIPAFAGFLILLAFTEEGIWDALLWDEHRNLFAVFHWMLAPVRGGHSVWLLPLLALPQATHYILDAFIWRVRGTSNDWRSVLRLE
ncbi:MAG: hypothetical protein JNM27_07580 [Leptospirales bacterium]|nr:hypothetical protein [Leptospirales bacterium]